MFKAYSKVLLGVLVLATVIVLLLSAGYGMYLAADSKVYWCRDFKSQEQAQKAFDTGKEQYQRLDGDNDGEACESHIYMQKNNIKVK